MYKLSNLIVVSQTLQDWYKKHLVKSTKVRLIQNGVDVHRFTPFVESRDQFFESKKIDKSCLLLGTCARLEPIKNLDMMLRVFQEFHTKNPESRLLLIGDGSQRTRLEQLARELHIESAVIFAGQKSNTVKLMQAIDIYLITSRDEGLPLAALEALACGKPIITRAVGELPKIITPELGKVIESDDISVWRLAIEQVWEDKDAYFNLSDNARRKAVETYSEEKCLQGYFNLLFS